MIVLVIIIIVPTDFQLNQLLLNFWIGAISAITATGGLRVADVHTPGFSAVPCLCYGPVNSVFLSHGPKNTQKELITQAIFLQTVQIAQQVQRQFSWLIEAAMTIFHSFRFYLSDFCQAFFSR